MHRLLILVTFTAIFITHMQAQKNWRPFSSDSPWNQKIPADVNADENSPALIADFASRGPLYINIKEWSIPLYIIDADTTPGYNVGDLRPGVYGRGFEYPRHIPIPHKAIASAPVNGDNHLCIVDTVKELAWDMWWARQDAAGQWFTGLGAITNLSGSGVAPPWFAVQREFDSHRARASGFPLIAGLIRVDEMKTGKIEHALVFAYDHCRSEFFIPPASTAQATKDDIRNDFGIPMGGRIQLDPDWDVENSALTESGKIIARALQEYGAYCGDFAGANVLYAENSPQAIIKWQDIMQSDELYKVFTAQMIKKHFRVIDMGNVWPGQNFSERPPYLISFSLPGQTERSMIDYFKKQVLITVNPQVNIKNMIAEFETSGKDTRVYIRNKEQISTETANDFSMPLNYTLLSMAGTSKEWRVIVTQK